MMNLGVIWQGKLQWKVREIWGKEVKKKKPEVGTAEKYSRNMRRKIWGGRKRTGLTWVQLKKTTLKRNQLRITTLATCSVWNAHERNLVDGDVILSKHLSVLSSCLICSSFFSESMWLIWKPCCLHVHVSLVSEYWFHAAQNWRESSDEQLQSDSHGSKPSILQCQSCKPWSCSTFNTHKTCLSSHG